MNIKQFIAAALITVGILALGSLPRALGACANSVWPGALDNYTAGQCIPSQWANILESTIGITGSFNFLPSSTNVVNTLNGGKGNYSITTSGTGLGETTSTTSTNLTWTNPGYITTSTNQVITFTASGDATGTATGTTSIAPAMHVVALQGKSVTSTAPATGTVLEWNGTYWIPLATSSLGLQAAGNYLTAAVTSINGDTTAAQKITVSGGLLTSSTAAGVTTLGLSTTTLNTNVAALGYVTSTSGGGGGSGLNVTTGTASEIPVLSSGTTTAAGYSWLTANSSTEEVDIGQGFVSYDPNTENFYFGNKTATNNPIFSVDASGNVTIYAQGGNLRIQNGNGYNAIQDSTVLTADRIFSFPDEPGTYALQGDNVSEFTNDAGYLTGTKVDSLGGATGAVTLGNGLSITAGTLSASSTYASTTLPLTIFNATTTAPSYVSYIAQYPFTISQFECVDAAGTTTFQIYLASSYTSTAVASTILSSFACGTAGNSTTSFTTSNVTAGQRLIVNVTSTAGTPTLTTGSFFTQKQ